MRATVYRQDIEPALRAELGMPLDADAQQVVWSGEPITRPGQDDDRDWPDHDLEVIGVAIGPDDAPTGPLRRKLALPTASLPSGHAERLARHPDAPSPDAVDTGLFLDLWQIIVRRRDTGAFAVWRGTRQWAFFPGNDDRQTTLVSLHRLARQLRNLTAPPQGRPEGSGIFATESEFSAAYLPAYTAVRDRSLRKPQPVDIAAEMDIGVKTLRRCLKKWPQDDPPI